MEKILVKMVSAGDNPSLVIDQFPNQRLLLDYLYSRLKGYTIEIILPRFRVGGFNRYTILRTMQYFV